MQIKTEQDMLEFCDTANKGFPLNITVTSSSSQNDVEYWESANKEMIEKGKIGKGSHLQQGIVDICLLDRKGAIGKIQIEEVPYLYPSPKILAENPLLTGPMTGCLVNCYDPQTGNLNLFLFHMRGRDIASAFGFQAAAAGMGYFREHLAITAKRELAEEAGIYYPATLFKRQATDILPFMKKGGDRAVPQPLFSFGFSNDLSRFPVCRNLEEITEFEAKIKEGLKNKTIEQKEGYHFTVPAEHVEKIAGELNDKKRFYGPIYESTMNFVRALRNSGDL